MFTNAKNVRLASFLALTCSLRLSLALSGSYWISPCLSLALYGSHCHSLAYSGPLWLTCSLISRIQSLIGSQGPCSALSTAATLTHFLLLCKSPRWLQICGYHQSAERMLVVVQSFPNFRGPSLANKFNAAPLISLSWHRFWFLFIDWRVKRVSTANIALYLYIPKRRRRESRLHYG